MDFRRVFRTSYNRRIMTLNIVHYPHPTLRRASRPLKTVDATLRRWIAEMLELMYEHQGVGLAANQVDLPYRMFVANPEGDPDNKESEHVFINPVLRGGRGSAEAEEGCLSIPGVYAPVTRNEKIRVVAFNLKGEEISAEVSGLFARVVQHETDHLDGTLFVDRLGPAHKASVREKLEEFELEWKSKRETGEFPDDETIAAHWTELENART